MVDSENPVIQVPHPRVYCCTNHITPLNPVPYPTEISSLSTLPHPHPSTLTMASPIAGPSRLPFNAIRTVARQRLPTASRYASSSSSGEEQPVDQRTQEAEDAYRSWINSTGRQYKSVRTGQRALWLGGSHVRSLFPSS